MTIKIKNKTKQTNSGGAAPILDSSSGAASSLLAIGTHAVKEAFEGDLRNLENMLTGAIRKELNIPAEKGWWINVQGVFDDSIVIETQEGKLHSYDYTVDGTNVTLGEPVEVIKSFVPVGDASVSEAAACGFVEAKTNSGTFRIRVIRAGVSKNNNFYSDQLLRDSVAMFESVRVFVKGDEEHTQFKGKDVRNLIGALKNVAFVEGDMTDTGEIHADLALIEPKGEIAIKMHEAWNQQLTDLFGFSIAAYVKAAPRIIAGKRVAEATKFTSIKSVDLIVEPGAGGGIITLTESLKGDTIMLTRENLIKLLVGKALIAATEAEKMTDDELNTRLSESLNAPEEEMPAGEAGVTEAAAKPSEDVIAVVEARMAARETIDSSALPQAAKKKLRKQFSGDVRFTEAEVQGAIKDELEYLGAFTESGSVSGMGLRIEAGESREEKTVAMLEAFFDVEHKDHKHSQSIKDCYVAMTGDTRVTGRMSESDNSLMTEALGTASLSAVLGNSMHRAMLADYNAEMFDDIWKNLANIVPLQDFRTNERTRIGGYGDMPVVNENADYQALTSPTDEKAGYAAKKYGGIETISLEMIKNDDVGAIRRIPLKMSRGAKRTLSKFVLNLLADNAAIYDAKALFHADHKNLGTAELDKISFAAARLRMLQQTELDSNEPLGIAPAFLWVPSTLEEAAVDLFRRTTENDKNFIQSQSVQVMPVRHWTDANNWFLSADKNEVPSIEVGFLDGQQEPELFVQDAANHGSHFAADKISYKLRHAYGGTVTDFRGVDGSVVA